MQPSQAEKRYRGELGVGQGLFSDNRDVSVLLMIHQIRANLARV